MEPPSNLREHLLLHRGPGERKSRHVPQFSQKLAVNEFFEVCCEHSDGQSHSKSVTTPYARSANHAVFRSAPSNEKSRGNGTDLKSVFPPLLCRKDRSSLNLTTGAQCILSCRTGYLGHSSRRATRVERTLVDDYHIGAVLQPLSHAGLSVCCLQNNMLCSSVSHFSSLRCRTLVQDGRGAQADAGSAADSAYNRSGSCTSTEAVRAPFSLRLTRSTHSQGPVGVHFLPSTSSPPSHLS